MNKSENVPRCRHSGGMIIKPDGVHELLACDMETVEMHRNATVVVRRCRVCGYIDIGWLRQDNTESDYGAGLDELY